MADSRETVQRRLRTLVDALGTGDGPTAHPSPVTPMLCGLIDQLPGNRTLAANRVLLFRAAEVTVRAAFRPAPSRRRRARAPEASDAPSLGGLG